MRNRLIIGVLVVILAAMLISFYNMLTNPSFLAYLSFAGLLVALVSLTARYLRKEL